MRLSVPLESSPSGPVSVAYPSYLRHSGSRYFDRSFNSFRSNFLQLAAGLCHSDPGQRDLVAKSLEPTDGMPDADAREKRQSQLCLVGNAYSGDCGQ